MPPKVVCIISTPHQFYFCNGPFLMGLQMEIENIHMFSSLHCAYLSFLNQYMFSAYLCIYGMYRFVNNVYMCALHHEYKFLQWNFFFLYCPFELSYVLVIFFY